MKKPSSLITRLQHLGTVPCDADNPVASVATPSVRTSTVRFHSLAQLDRVESLKAQGERVMNYGRMGLQTHADLEQIFAELENGDRCFLASSGVGAISMTLLSLLSQGDHMVCTDNVYGPVRFMDETILQRMGIRTSYVGGHDYAAIEAAITPNTKILYAESPGSLLLEMLDFRALAEIAKKHDLIFAVDNTWGSGLIYTPLDLGADISIIAGTKYVGGHSDLMLGAVVVKGQELVKRIDKNQYALGYSISADDAWLAIRGVRTMPIRMKQHAENALKVCDFLATLPATEAIYHPAYQGDQHHDLWQRDCKGSNGLLSVEFRGSREQTRAFVDALDIFFIGYSWGGFESLVQWVRPEGLTHHSYTSEAVRCGDNHLIRLHVGLEDVDDLIADLQQAYDQAFGA
ncbi:MAG: aminotransferase class I/II-fold pyridoxal phosphate-dependent enzyme [Alcaligenaceae bacterium]|nr:aminotransferase class I/II-fold pyridoxal phosphate-dependent enzyme [Alcaligenaceae bacterium]